MKKILICILSITFLCGLSSCNFTSTLNDTVEITDMIGETVYVKKNPKKVACVSRTSYDLLVAFGLENYIDGTYEKTLDNKWTSVLYEQSVKHFKYEYEPNIELLLSRRVDLVFSPEKRITDLYRDHGISAITVSLYGNPTFDNYVYFISELATKIWDDDTIKVKAHAWKNKVQTAINDIQNKLIKQNVEKRKLFYVRGDKDKGINYTDTKGSFVEYAYRTLGFDCMSSILGSDGNKPSQEAICEFNPDVFVMGGIYQNKHVDDIKTLAPYTTLDAVKNNNIFTIPFTILNPLFSPNFFILYYKLP